MQLKFTNDHPRVNEAPECFINFCLRLARILVNERFPVLCREKRSLLSLPRSPPFSAALFLRSPDQSVAKRGLQTSRVPGEFPRAANSVWEKGRECCSSSTPRATWNRNVIIIAGLRIRMFFRSSNLLTYYTTRIDALGTMAWPQKRFPYYANTSALPAPSAAPHPASLRLLVLFSIGG